MDSLICSIYNWIRIVSEVGLSSLMKGGVSMSDYELIMLLLQVMAVVIAFGALVALICFGKSK